MPFYSIKKQVSNDITNMGISENSHAKIDKETQSPLLKIFREIMTREKDDPEKRNLLNEPREEKKRRPYSLSKNKSDHRSCDSSNNSEHRKRGGPYKVSSTEQRAEFHNKARSQSMPYQSEKKDSWWFWTFVSQQNCSPQQTRRSEDTCSCVSCALKKIVNSEYACVGCLLLLFTISIAVAFLVVFKGVPSDPECPCKTTTTTTKCPPKCKECKCGVADSERLKRKIEMLNNKRLEKGFVGLDEFRKNDNKGYESLPPGHLDVSGGVGIDFGPSFRELNSVDESEHKLLNDMDLSNVLESDKNIMNDVDGSGKLREFYKKLVQTDAKIRSLKKITEGDARYVEDDIQKSPERSRRSLKLYHYPKRYRGLRPRKSIFGKHQVNETGGTKHFGNKTRLKRFTNESDEPTGFIIEKKKLLVQYKPLGKKRFPVKKCQHAPAGTHTHEKQMMHPFYKNSQKLDLLLDKFLNKNLPEIMADPFGLDDLFNHDKLIKHCKHPKPHKNVNILGKDQLVDQIPKPKLKLKSFKEEKVDSLKENQKLTSAGTPDLMKMLSPESTTECERDFFNHKLKMIGKEKKKILKPSSSDFEILLAVSTIMNPDIQRVTKAPSTFHGLKMQMKDRIPNLRRLMQIEVGEEEDKLGYEDFNEVLTDDMENHDEMEKVAERKRRENKGANIPPAQPVKFKQINPPQGVLNPNWKGAMPLYPDEINSMITNKQVELPKQTFGIQDLLDVPRKARDLSDIEYVEDYLASKYNKLVQQAQAYSDYGVLEGKKESRNEKESPTVHTVPNHKIKLLADENVLKAGLLERLKRGKGSTVGKGEPKNEACEKDVEVIWTAQTGSKNPLSRKNTEGIRFELQPTTAARDDSENNIQIMKIVSKHIKLKPRPGSSKQSQSKHKSSLIPHFIHSSIFSTYPDLGLIFNTKPGEFTTETTKNFKSLGELGTEDKGILFAMTRGNRRLLSTKFASSGDFRDYKDSTENRGTSTESDPFNIDKFVDKLNMNKSGDSSTSLKNFIEKARDKNIEIYSTPHPFNSKLLADSLRNANLSAEHPKDSSETPKFDAESSPPSIVTINKSLVKLGDNTPENFLGKILMSVKDPEFGLQNFNLMFDIPLVMNFKEELMMMNDNINYPNVYNQFDILTDSTIDPQVTGTSSYDSRDFYTNSSSTKRLKRETQVTATWSTKSETKDSTEKDSTEFGMVENKMDESTTVSALPFNDPYDDKPSVPATPSDLKADDQNVTDVNSTAKTNRASNDTLAIGDNMTLSDFFSVVGDWFKALEYGKFDKPRHPSGSVLTDMLLTLNNNSSIENKITTTESAYPMYDSDMIENIGHRSRVLLSVNDFVVNITEVKLVNNTNFENATVAGTAADGNGFNETTPTTVVVSGRRSNFTTTHKSNYKKIINPPKRKKKQIFKAKVKRNADDSNLIFWNDIYDDEYGIQPDKMDNYMKGKIDDAEIDKQSVQKKDFLKRSGRWVQNKIKKFARKINPHTDAITGIGSDSMEIKQRIPRSIKRSENFGLADYSVLHNRIDSRPVGREKDDRDEIEEDYPDVDQKSLFAALSVNMKEVCKKAAKAVQETRRIDNMPYNDNKNGGRAEDTKQGSIASALMQQLVRLLTDLVDYQVQQKTCTKLPPDLQTFLEWLTFNKEDVEEPEKPLADQSELLYKTPNQEDEELIEALRDRPEEKADFPIAVKPGEKTQSLSGVERSHYLDTIHSVQDLLEQFDDMPDDDKSKMTGVKGYLENQLAFLNKQLSAYDLYAFFDKHDRRKRDIFIMQQHQTTKHRPRRKPHKFFKNFGRKHTRTTVAYNDEAQVTDIMMNKKTNENAEINNNENTHQKVSKRNLQDVYYKAVAEAKKCSTAKSLRNEEISRFVSSTASKQH